MARSAVRQAPDIHDIKEAVAAIVPHGYVSDRFLWNFMAAYDAPQSMITQLHGALGDSLRLTGAIWPSNLHFIEALPGDVDATLQAMVDTRRTKRNKVRFLMTCDGTDIAARDLKTDTSLFCSFDELADNYGFFLPLAGIESYVAAEENPVDVKATKNLSQIYDAILAEPKNADWRTSERQHDLNHFMAQLIFCLFAEDTGIFPDNLFSRTLHDHCARQPWTAAEILKPIFDAMSVDGDARLTMPGFATAFPFVNGGLFRGDNPVPHISKNAYRRICDAARQDWGRINPDIFGSMIQAIADADQRSELGLHYTSVPNILKVLDPLFLDDLREAKVAAWNDRRALMALLERMTKIRIFDPAAGSGNFLVIAYKELRRLEMQIIERLHDRFDVPAPLWPHVRLQNFYGIEIQDFSCETARLGLWLAEYQMNRAYGEIFGKHAPPLPLRDACTIRHDNALRMDWRDVCPPTDDPAVDTYIVGNPPYLGSKKREEEQKLDINSVTEPYEKRYGRFGDLDYVGGWFIKAAELLTGMKGAAAFVATNSICQGQQVAMLWPLVFDLNMEIGFAHRSFKWSNLAKNNAGVTCVIVGIRSLGDAPKHLYENGVRTCAQNISPYLLDGLNIIVKKVPKSLSKMPEMLFGNMPRSKHLVLNKSEKERLIDEAVEVQKYIRKFVGSEDFIKQIERYCIWIDETQVNHARLIPSIGRILTLVAQERSMSAAESTQAFAEKPYRFVQIQGTGATSIIIPRVSSENRQYLPVGWLTGGEIISDSAFAIYDAEMWLISLIGSRLHQLWVATICGRLRTDIRYSNTLGWNTFPVPNLSDDDKAALTKTAEGILLARDMHFPATIAALYDPEKMPENLREAHRANDVLVESLYATRPFSTDTERLQHLFDRYVAMTRDGADR